MKYFLWQKASLVQEWMERERNDKRRRNIERKKIAKGKNIKS